MPGTPYIVSGTATNSVGDIASNVIITFQNSTTSSSIFSTTTNSEGKYIFDLAELGYSGGDSISYNATGEFNNETYSGSFVVSGANKSLNVSLSELTDALTGCLPSNRSTHIYSVGSKPITKANPFPVDVSSIPMGKGSFVLSYDSSNNLIKVVQTIGSSIYTLSLAYDSSNNLTSVSEWVKS